MAENKNQHFVPQFYLRNFSSDEERRSVALFNFKRRKTISGASIRQQCSRDYWHGHDDSDFEHHVRTLEGLGAAVIKACILTDRVNLTHRASAVDVLKMFTVFQLARTAYFAEALVESVLKMRALALDTTKDDTDEIEANPRRNIARTLQHTPILRDLATCLAVNRTDIDFITSDNPVVLGNWWFTHIFRQRPGPGIGLAQSGLEIYLPLSPRHQLILYDRDIWSVSKADPHGTIYVRNENDVLALNERQALNAHSNVYFASKHQSIDRLCEEAISQRTTEKTLVRRWIKSTKGKGYVHPSSPDAQTKITDTLISMEPCAIAPKRRVAFFSKRFRPRYDEHPSVIGALRDYAWFQIVEDFRTQRTKPLGIRETDIDIYAAKHPLIHRVKSWKYEYWDVVERAG